MKKNTAAYFCRTVFKLEARKCFSFTALLLIFLFLMTLECAKPFIFQLIFDEALPNKNIPLLLHLISILLMMLIGFAIGNFIVSFLSASLGGYLITYLKLLFFRKIQMIRGAEINEYGSEKIMSVFSSDFDFLESFVTYSFWIICYNLLFSFVSLVFLFYTGYILASYVLSATVVFFFIIPNWLSKNAQKYIIIKQENNHKILGFLREDIVQHNTISFLSLKNHRLLQMKNYLKKFYKPILLYNFHLGFAAKVLIVSVELISLSTLAFGVTLIIYQKMTLGSLIAFMFFLFNIVTAVTTISGHYPNLERAMSSLARIYDFLGKTNPLKPNLFKQGTIDSFEKLIFTDVGLKINNQSILSNIHLSVKKNEFVAIVGHSGAGKSTLLSLLLRTQSVTEGSITLNNFNIYQIKASDFYKKIKYVAQQESLFSGLSIFDNIKLGNMKATNEDIYEAAQLAEIHLDILSMPKSYETLVNDDIALSVGQIQRIALARALASKPDLLCLDEVSSALDTATACQLDDTFSHLKGKMAILMVTHRIQSASLADKIIVIDKGKIIEAGTHINLLEEKGAYYKSVSQSSFS